MSTRTPGAQPDDRLGTAARAVLLLQLGLGPMLFSTATVESFELPKVVALKLAAPVFCTILIVNASMAMLGRAVAQMNVFVLSFPLTIAAGLFVMGLALPYSLHLFESEFLKLMQVIFGLLQRLGHG